MAHLALAQASAALRWGRSCRPRAGGHAPHGSIYSEYSAAASSSGGSSAFHNVASGVAGHGSGAGPSSYMPVASSAGEMPPLPPFPEEFSAQMPTYFPAGIDGASSNGRPSIDAHSQRCPSLPALHSSTHASSPSDPFGSRSAYPPASDAFEFDSPNEHPTAPHMAAISMPLPPPESGAVHDFGAGGPGNGHTSAPRAPKLGLRRGPSFTASMRAVSGARELGTLPKGIGSSDPKTPAEYALNVLMSRWVQFAGSKVEACVHSGVSEQ